MNPFEFFIPQNIIVGAGTLVRLPECAQKCHAAVRTDTSQDGNCG